MTDRPFVKSQLIKLVRNFPRQFELPPISRIYMPEPDPSPDRETEFGVVVLEDGSAGLYYAWLGASQKGMNKRYRIEDYIGQTPLEMVHLFDSSAEADCSLGMAAINAISQHIFQRAGFVPETAGDSLGALQVNEGDHIGMIGYFASIARRLNERGIRVTVIERKEKFVRDEPLLTITVDTGQLTSCNKIISTASIMLNNSVDEILRCVSHADEVVIIGPTAGFLPDPLFERGVTVVGGSVIADADLSIIRLKNQQGLGDSARKYVIYRNRYPGAAALLNAAITSPG